MEHLSECPVRTVLLWNTYQNAPSERCYYGTPIRMTVRTVLLWNTYQNDRPNGIIMEHLSECPSERCYYGTPIRMPVRTVFVWNTYQNDRPNGDRKPVSTCSR